MFIEIKNQCAELIKNFDEISFERKKILQKIATHIQEKRNLNLPINLVYICTHNSRRSHFGQIWSAVASTYYQIEDVHTFSGGTEATAFHKNAINALKTQGFEIEQKDDSNNPIYKVNFGENEFTNCFSKVYDHAENPKTDFIAIMTCSDAEENCPFIPGAEMRISTTYDDPKAFDGTEMQDAKYMERSKQIALETLYLFSLVK